MSFAIVWAGVGAHRKHTRIELAIEIESLKNTVAYLDARREAYAAQLDIAQIDLTTAREDLADAVAEIKRLQNKVIRAEADKARLRQAVVDARPRITVVDTQLVRPYAPVVVLPYTSPVPVAVQHDYADDPVHDED